MKVTTIEYSFTPSQITYPVTPSTMADVWAVMPLVILIFVMVMLNDIIKALLQPEVLKGVAPALITRGMK